MPRVTIFFAVLLILLGIVGYAGTPTAATSTGLDASPSSTSADTNTASEQSKRSVTALIPAFTGGLLLIFGLIALNERWRMHAMHGAVLIGLLGFLAAGGRGASGVAKVMTSDVAVNGRSLFFVCAMAVLCGVYVGLSVNSFIQARKRRRAESVPAA